jgi:hypothetical protein
VSAAQARSSAHGGHDVCLVAVELLIAAGGRVEIGRARRPEVGRAEILPAKVGACGERAERDACGEEDDEPPGGLPAHFPSGFAIGTSIVKVVPTPRSLV